MSDPHYKSSIRKPGNTVFDYAAGEVRRVGGPAPGPITTGFRRLPIDSRPSRKVPFPGDPPVDLAQRRAMAEAGNPGLRRVERLARESGETGELPYYETIGFQAFKAGVPEEGNPYAFKDAKWKGWRRGWRKAQSRSEEQ